jgi:hypothetical protein
LLPTVSPVVSRVATLLDRVALPNRVDPSKKLTIPVGDGRPVAGVIVAVNVTTCPETGNVGENVTTLSAETVTVVAGAEVLPR